MVSLFSGLTSFIFGGNRTAVETHTNAQRNSDAEQPPAAESLAGGNVTGSRLARDLSFANTLESSQNPAELPPPYRSVDESDSRPRPETIASMNTENLTAFEQRFRWTIMYISSMPGNRWDDQVDVEKIRLAEKWTACNLKREFWLEGEARTALAKCIVQRRWQEQGIAKEAWFRGQYPKPCGMWPHQEIGDEQEHRPHQVRRLDSSRPFFQFMHEIAAERDHLEFIADPPQLPAEVVTHPVEPQTEMAPDNLHTTAYDNVVDQWEAQGIWDSNWGVLPGMFWKHEKPIREMFQEEFGSDAGIGSAAERHSDSLQPLSHFRRRRIAPGSHVSKSVEKVLRRAEWGPPPSLYQAHRYSPDAGYIPRPSQWIYPPVSLTNEESDDPESREPSSGLFQSSLEVADSARNTTESLSTRGIFGGDQPRRCLFSGAILENRAAEENRLAGTGTEPQGLFGGNGAVNERVMTASRNPIPLFGADPPIPPPSLTREEQPVMTEPQGLGIFGAPQLAPSSSLWAPEPPSDPSSHSLPWPRLQEVDMRDVPVPSPAYTGLPPIREESEESDRLSESVYGDENADAPLNAIQAQLDAAQSSLQQVLEVHNALAAELAKVRGSSGGQQQHRGPFSSESHQRRVLAPLPSLQRVTKKNKGRGSTGSPGSATSSRASTVIRASLRLPSPSGELFSAEPARAFAALAPNDFSIREDDDVRDQEAERERERQAAQGQDSEDVEMTDVEMMDLEVEEPRVSPSPRARARQRRRGAAERSNQPVRRSARRTANRRLDIV